MRRSLLFTIIRRFSSNSSAKGEYKTRGSENKAKDDLKNYLEGKSPLKNVKANSEWATMPYPEGTVFEKVEKPTFDLDKTSVIMFPGQGNQFVGMCSSLLHHTVVEDMFDAASTILGYNLKKLCLEGPENKLNKTEYCQPATLVSSLAAIEELKVNYPMALSNCIATCGFSVGELAALVFAGCISFDKAVHITRVRAEAMQECSEAVPSGLLSVLYGADSNLKEAMADAKEECIRQGISDPVCEVANFLITECKVIGGHDVALKYIQDNMKKYKIRKVSRLKVSGAFHTSLMKEAALPFAAALEKIEINEPLVPVISNVTAKPYKGVKDILKKLPQQIYRPVKWEQIITFIYNKPGVKGCPHTYECGPGKSLSITLNRTYRPAAVKCHKITV